MKIQCLEIEDIALIRAAEDRLCGKDGFQLKAEVKNAIANGHKRIILDLALVTEIDSAGLMSLFACHEMIKPHGKLIVVTENKEVKNTLSLARLNRVLPVKDSRQEALDALLTRRTKAAVLGTVMMNPALAAQLMRAYERA